MTTVKIIEPPLVKVAIVGSVDSGKSTFVGVLKNGILDDGKGKAREHILTLKHEKETGRTTSINMVFIEFTNLEHHLALIDLAGHEPYLRTTLNGLSSYFPNYAIIVIDANRGILMMTKKHIKACLGLNIPFFVVVTKIDTAPPNQIKDTLTEIKLFMKVNCRKKFIFLIKNKHDIDSQVSKYLLTPDLVCPIFLVSNVKGIGIDNIKNFLIKLRPKSIVNPIINFINDYSFSNLFHIYKPYFKDGIGFIVYGENHGSPINKGDILKLGPRVTNNKTGYILVKVKNIRNKNNQDILSLNKELGCLVIRPLDTKFKLNKLLLSDGRVLIGEKDIELRVNRIRASVLIYHHHTTIKLKYQPYIHCANVRCSASIINSEKLPLRSKDISSVVFEFTKPQFIFKGARLLMREGGLKGLGIITEIDPKIED